MYELTTDVFPPSNFAVFNCCYILCYWLQRVETCTNCIDKQALLIFEPNWCIRLHLLRVKSCANEKKCKQWSHNEPAYSSTTLTRTTTLQLLLMIGFFSVSNLGTRDFFLACDEELRRPQADTSSAFGRRHERRSREKKLFARVTF